MGLLKYLPIIGDWLSRVFGTFSEGANRKAELAHEAEMEMIRRGKGRPTPKMVMGYAVSAAFMLCIVWALLSAFFPDVPAFPFELRDLVSLAGLLFGFGG